LRIVYFTDTYLPNTDGVVTSIKLVSEYLSKYGHEVYVFCPSGVQENKYVIPITSKIYEKYPQYKVSFPSFEVITKIKEINPDIIHLHTPVTIGLTGLYLGKILNIPTVQTYHTRLDSYMWYIRSRNDDRFTDIFTRWLYNQSPVIVPSESIKKILRNKNIKSNITVLPNPVNIKLKHEKKKRNHIPVILHVGRICREKQIDLVLIAFKKVLQRRKANLIITSSGPDEDRLKQIVKKLKIGDHVKFTGYLTTQKLGEAYAESDIFVTASETETQGLVVLEAMANGCVVIARKAPGFIDVIENRVNGILYETMDELVEKIIQLIDDDSLRKRLVDNGTRSVEKYHPDRIVKKLIEYYNLNLKQVKQPTLDRLLYSLSILFSFLCYSLVIKLDLPINSRLTNISVDVLKHILRLAEFFRI
jgi:1,2-diacylglycerol 3-alpha-glucosyltransferase